MAAAQVHSLLNGQGSDAPAEEAAAEAAAVVVLQLVRVAGFARARARKLRSSDPRSADTHQALFARLQLAAAACVQSDESGKARGEEDVQKLFRSEAGRKALEHAVQIGAKELLAQPVVRRYIKIVWRGQLLDMSKVPGWAWGPVVVVLPLLVLLVLLLNLLFLLPLVALLPALDPWLAKKGGGRLYLLHLPVVKFGLLCATDLALALVLTVVGSGVVAPPLLVWVGSGLLWEGRQLMAPSSSDASTWLARAYDRLAAYWGDSINRVDAMALIFSLAALVAFRSTGDSEDETGMSLRAVAVFLLWLRLIRVLLLSPQFGPFVLKG